MTYCPSDVSSKTFINVSPPLKLPLNQFFFFSNFFKSLFFIDHDMMHVFGFIGKFSWASQLNMYLLEESCHTVHESMRAGTKVSMKQGWMQGGTSWWRQWHPPYTLCDVMCVHCLNIMHVYSVFSEQILLKAYYMPSSVLQYGCKRDNKEATP